MRQFSKYFKLDTLDTNQTLKPIIVITDFDNNVLFTLSQDQDELFDNNGNSIDIINAVNKVSNIKISNEYDTKKLKINRFRFTLYNYYDVNTKLSSYINTNIVNKNVYLFYKSTTTNIINFSNIQGDYDCALIYVGEISRVSFDNNIIKLNAEDKTQIKISDKNVPSKSIDKLPVSIKERILPEYRDGNNTVPMTFGKVDKAFTLPYLEGNTSKLMNILLDSQPTGGNYKTSKIPKLLESGLPTSDDYCLYVIRDEDYIIIDHNSVVDEYNSSHNITINRQVDLNSRIILSTQNDVDINYLIPELQDSVDISEGHFKRWTINGYHQRLVESIFASDGSITDIRNIDASDLSNVNFSNIDRINDNGGYAQTWYRDGDEITSFVDNFDTNLKNYSTGGPAASGRWILLKLKEGVSDQLLNIKSNNVWIGNTFFCCDWKMYQSLDDTTPNNDTLVESGIQRTGFFVAPISIEIWKRLFNSENSRYAKQANLNLMLLRNDEEIQLAEESINFDSDTGAILDYENAYLQDAFAETLNTYRDAPIHINKGNLVDGGSTYWGSYGVNNGLNAVSEYKKIQGLYYGQVGNYNREVGNPANEHDLIAIFEYFPPWWEGINSYSQGLKMNNIGFLHSVIIEDLQKEEIYASIIGRRNVFYTQQTDYLIGEFEEFDPNTDITGILKGQDGLMSDVYDLQESFHTIIKETFNQTYGTGIGSNEYFITNQNSSTGGMNFYNLLPTETVNPENIFSNMYAQNIIDDNALNNIHYFWKNFIWRVATSPLAMYDLINVHSYTQPSEEFPNMADNYWIYQDSPILKFLILKILEYMYQEDITPLGEDQGYYGNFWFKFANGQGMGGLLDNHLINITDAIEEKMIGNNWNDYNITTLDDWFNNFYVYFDNLVYAVQKSLAEHLSTIIVNVDGQHNTDILNNYDSMINQHPILGGISHLEGNLISLEELREQVMTYLSYQVNGLDYNLSENDGIIRKPSDIVMNILVNEMEYAKIIFQQSMTSEAEYVAPDYSKFDMESIDESREAHSDWQMGFSIKEKQDGKNLIEEILNESKSYPRFSVGGKFGLLTIKDSYSYEDIDKIIDINDIIDYNFEQTKREDIITSVKMFYRFDYGIEEYGLSVEKSIVDILPEWSVTGFDNYNIEESDGYKEIELKYHTDKSTVQDFAKHKLMNNCNVHNIVDMKLPLIYSDLLVGDVIHFPLINNEKIFNIDYSNVEVLNGQPIYPLWIIMETNITTNGINIKAYQLHYLGTDGDHGFIFPEESESTIIGNTEQFSELFFTNGEPIPNWNWNSSANIDNGVRIPYFDVDADGILNVVDLAKVVGHIAGNIELTQSEKDRLKYRSDGTLKENNDVGIMDLISMVNIITSYE